MRAYSGRYEGNPTAILQAYNDLFSSPPWIVGLDIETISIKDQTILGIGISTPMDDNFYFTWPDEIASMPTHLFQPSSVRKVWHNAPFDLGREGLGKYNADIDNIEDTAIITRLLNIPTVLSEVAEAFTGVVTWSVKGLFEQYSKQIGKQVKTMLQLPPEWVAHKCMRDAKACLQLYLQLYAKVDKEYYQVERNMTSLLLHMSHRGILLDQELVEKLDEELTKNHTLFLTACSDLYNFNPHSPRAVAGALGRAGIILEVDWRAKKTFGSTGKDVLEKINHPIAHMTLKTRKYNHLRNIVHGLVGKERAYSSFHMDAATGRIASYAASEDEIQQHNIPTGRRLGDIVPNAAPIRRIFLPDSEQGFTIWDLSQVELRVLQYFSKDPVLLDALNDPNGGVHSMVQRELGIHSRVMAKNFVFGGFVYGGSPFVLAKFTGIQDTNILQGYLNKLNALFPITAAAIQRQREEGYRDMKVQTLYGRTLRLNTYTDGKESTEKHIKNCAINYPIQGSAGEIFKRLMLERAKSIGIDNMILQVHDEGLEDGVWPLEGELENIAGFKTPIEVKEQPTRRWQ